MILFGIFALVLVGYVASASVKNSKHQEIVDEQQADIGLVKVDPWDGRSVQFKKEQADRTTDHQAREGRFLFPQEWYEVAFLAVSLKQCYLVSPHKNGHILPTGQWYAPSAVTNDALIMQ